MQRTGRTNRPFYRIQVLDKRARRNGASIEQLGWYDPIEKNPAKQLKLDEERVKYWIGVGAQPSDTLRDILAKKNLIKTGPWEKLRARERANVEAAKAAAAAAPGLAAEAAARKEAKKAAADAAPKEEKKAE
jgi:small subunit ribosomal protein S16